MEFERSFDITPANPNDFSGVRRFFRLVDAEFLPPLSERDAIDDLVWRYLNDNGCGCLICRNGAAIRAVVAFEYINRQRSSVYLTFFAVHPKYRRKRFGLTCRTEVLKWLKRHGVREVITRTWSTNRAMCRLNEKVGFLVERVIADDRGPGIDTIYFKKYL